MNKVKRVIVTGGAGFIGHHFIQHIVRNTEWEIIIIDKLNYASRGLQRLREIRVIYDPMVKIFTWDLIYPFSDGLRREIGDVNYIFHLAAESHVDKSIKNPSEFVLSNVLGTERLLEFAKNQNYLDKFIYFNTDEIYGTAEEGISYKEDDRCNPSNPYSASKAGAGEMCTAFHRTYGLPVIQTICMNNFGERQDVEKFIPMCIKKILNGDEIIIHSYPGAKKSGTRSYIHARNSADAILHIVNNGISGEKYNIKGEREISNYDIAKKIADIMDKKLKYKFLDFHSERPGHDLRYDLDGSKLEKLGWKQPIDFEKSLEKTINWTLKHPEWLEEN